MTLSFTPLRLEDHRACPTKRVTLTGSLLNEDPDRAMSVLALTGEVWFGEPEFVVQSARPMLVFGPTLRAGRDELNKTTAQLQIDLPPHVLKAVEERRRAKGNGGVDLTLEMKCVVAPVFRLQDGRGHAVNDYVGSASNPSVNVRTDGFHGGLRVSRDQWQELLQKVGYQETEIFEVAHVLVEGKGEPCGRMLDRLREAKTCLRDGHPRNALETSRLAFEAIANGLGADTRKGMEKLLDLCRPGEDQRAKREALDGLLLALAKFQHLARHEKSSHTPIDYLDADLGYALSLSIAQYLSRLLPPAVRP